MKRLNKRGAIELSMTTIVVLVIAITLLIMGFVLVRKVMCAGIILGEDVTEYMRDEIRDLFGDADYGVKCVGEGGQEVKIGDGAKRQIGCIIKENTDETYTLNVKSVESLSGVSTSEVESWVIDQDWSGDVPPGETKAIVLVLDIDRDVPATALKIELEETSGSGITATHILYIDVEHTGIMTSAIC